MPPTGAFGGNSGIHDAHNLAWKLAMVIRGEADAELLDTYDAERRPVIARTMAQALARLQRWFRDPAGRLPPPVAVVDDYDVVFGQRYDSGAFVTEGPPPDRPFEPVAELSGRPGARAPHLVVERDGERISMLDLFDSGVVLLAGDDAWGRAAAAFPERIPLGCHVVGADGELRVTEGRWSTAYGVGPSAAVLVRPDGFVAARWQDAGGGPERRLSDAFQRLGLRQPVHNGYAR